MVKEKIVVLGAGYGGLRVIQQLNRFLDKKMPYELILIDKNNYHTFMTQLYEVAASTCDPKDITIPLEQVLVKSNVTFIQDSVNTIDFTNREVLLKGGRSVSFKYLVIALGSEPEYFGIKGLKENSISLSSLINAQTINIKVKSILEGYINGKGPEENRPGFVVGGGGLTGVELAGELACFLQSSIKGTGLAGKCAVTLVEASGELLPGMSSHVASYANTILKECGVEVITGDRLQSVVPGEINMASGRKIPFSLFIWAGGVRGNRVLQDSNLKVDQRGRLIVNQYLQYIDDPYVYAVGDSALAKEPSTGQPVLPTAQAALQHGQIVARNIYRDICGDKKLPYQPRTVLLLITVGRGKGLGETKKYFRITGRSAAWLKKIIPLRYLYLLGGLKLICHRHISSPANKPL